MLPIRCFGCGKVLGNKWVTWYILTEKKCIVDCFTKYCKDGTSRIVEYDKDQIIINTFLQYNIKDVVSKPIACDYLGLIRKCCRSVMISTVEY